MNLTMTHIILNFIGIERTIDGNGIARWRRGDSVSRRYSILKIRILHGANQT